MGNDRRSLMENMALGAWCDVAEESIERDLERARALACRFNSEQGLTTEQRTDMLRELFGAIGEGSTLSLGLRFDFGYNIFIGRRCFVNFNAVFLDGGRIVLGDDVMVGPNATFATPLHPLVADQRSTGTGEGRAERLIERYEPIVVEDGAWIASSVTVNPGVTIGAGAVIGSGSVVTGNIPANTLAYGNPCRSVREITDADRIGNVF